MREEGSVFSEDTVRMVPGSGLLCTLDHGSVTAWAGKKAQETMRGWQDPQPTSGKQAVGMSGRTHDRQRQAGRRESSRAWAGAMRPLLGDPRLLGLVAPHLSSTPVSRTFPRHMLAPGLGPCSNRAKRPEQRGIRSPGLALPCIC